MQCKTEYTYIFISLESIRQDDKKTTPISKFKEIENKHNDQRIFLYLFLYNSANLLIKITPISNISCD